MWTRKELKINAKNSLKSYYWIGFAVCLISGAIGGIVSSAGSFMVEIGDALSSDHIYEDTLSYNLFLLTLLGMALITSTVISFAYNTFIGNIIQIGKKHFFLCGREQTPQINSLFMPFRRGRYANTLKTSFITNIYIFLWSLLFIIPGIMKSYEYYMVNFILAENPNIDAKRVLEISKYMTKGDKLNIFILELSFFGLSILGLFACCIGIYFVYPYYEATFAELYGLKRQEALDSGFVSYNELPGFNN